jgi:hypothetical protein
MQKAIYEEKTKRKTREENGGKIQPWDDIGHGVFT